MCDYGKVILKKIKTIFMPAFFHITLLKEAFQQTTPCSQASTIPEIRKLSRFENRYTLILLQFIQAHNKLLADHEETMYNF